MRIKSGQAAIRGDHRQEPSRPRSTCTRHRGDDRRVDIIAPASLGEAGSCLVRARCRVVHSTAQRCCGHIHTPFLSLRKFHGGSGGTKHVPTVNIPVVPCAPSSVDRVQRAWKRTRSNLKQTPRWKKGQCVRNIKICDQCKKDFAYNEYLSPSMTGRV